MDVQYIAEVNFLIFVHTIFLLNRLWKRLYLLNVRIWGWGGNWGGDCAQVNALGNLV